MSVVWDLVRDVDRHPEWWPKVVEVECEGLEEGCTYRQVTDTPFGYQNLDVVVDRLDELREMRIRCVNTGTFVDLALTDMRGGTLVDARFGMEPLTAHETLRRRRGQAVLQALARAVAGRDAASRAGESCGRVLTAARPQNADASCRDPSHVVSHADAGRSRHSQMSHEEEQMKHTSNVLAPSGVRPSATLTIRLATGADAPALRRLAQLDSAPPPKLGPTLVAQVGGKLHAALPLDGERPIADPFRRTAELVEMLAARARQLEADSPAVARWRPARMRRLRPALLPRS